MMDSSESSRSELFLPLLRLWGKTTGEPAVYHPALYHMLDVGHVALQLLSEQATPRWRRVLGRALDADADNLRDWLPWVVGLHDNCLYHFPMT